MIDYDYSLSIDLYSEKETQHPHQELKGPLKNVIVVEGPNGKGKSLLMNIIAMSSFGYENKNVPTSLKNDMADYLCSDVTSLSFNLTVKDPVSGKILKAKHTDGDKLNVKVSESLDGGSSFKEL